MADPTMMENSAIAPSALPMVNVASTPVAGVQTNANANIKVSPDSYGAFGFKEDPIIEKLNNDSAKEHMLHWQPAVKEVMNVASPTATPESRMKTAEIFKGANDARPEDVIQGVLNLNPAQVYLGLTGGSDRREEAISADGQRYYKIYNSRISPTNPVGELRRIEDANGKILDEKRMQDVGPLTSRSDITAERSAAFIARGQAFRDVAQANSASYIGLQNAATQAGFNGAAIADLAKENQALGSKLGKASLSPAMSAHLAGISSIRSGDAERIKNSREKFNQFVTGNMSQDDWGKLKDESGGFALGFTYKQGEGLSYGGKKVNSTDDIDRIVKNYEKDQSSDQNIERRKADLLEQAQIKATGNDLAALNDIRSFINNNAKIALLQNKVEEAGGIGVAKPNLPHQLGESFQSGTLKAISDKYYGDAANLFAQFIDAKRSQLRNGEIPPMGKWQAEFANSPEIIALRAKAKADSNVYLQSTQAEIAAKNAEKLPAGTVGVSPATVAAPPPDETNQSNKTQPRNSAKPPVSKPAGKRSILDIIK
jgi:hypothetical protein